MWQPSVVAVEPDPEPTPEPVEVMVEPDPEPLPEPVEVVVEPDPEPVPEPVEVAEEPTPSTEPEIVEPLVDLRGDGAADPLTAPFPLGGTGGPGRAVPRGRGEKSSWCR